MQARSRSLVPFFLLSSGLHLLLLGAWPQRQPEQDRSSTPIPVALLPSRLKEKTDFREKSRPPKALRPSPKPLERTAPSTRNRPPGIEEPRKNPEEVLEKEPVREALAREERGITRSSLPSLKELLPPVTWPTQPKRKESGEGAVRLDSREPRYIPYLTGVKRAIQLAWEYPEAALQRGIEGKLVLEFTISGSGGLSEATLVESSGSTVLDDEAIRAVRAASPFHPIPLWVGTGRLRIIASFEYHDNRVKYGPLPNE